MLDELKRSFVNLLFSVTSKVEKFERNNPNLKVIVAGATKARKTEEDSEPRYDIGWARSRRSVLILASDGLHCGDWFIPLTDIQDSRLLRISGGLLLKVSTVSGFFYQFGLQYDPMWENQTVIQVEKEDTVLAFSPPSLIIRLIVITWFTLMIIEDIVSQDVDIITGVYIFLGLLLVLPLVRYLFVRLMIIK